MYKSETLIKISYRILFLALPNTPGELIKIRKKIFYKFLWNSGPDRIKRRIVIKDVTAGGLKMINTNMFIKSLHISWLRQIIKQSDTVSLYSMSNISFGKLFHFGSGYIKRLSRI